MRVYLAGPISGMPENNFPAFHRAAADLRAAGHEVFNPAEFGAEKSESDRRAILRDELAWICDHAEAIALMPGWERSRGATAELALANAIDLKVLRLTATNQAIGSVDHPSDRRNPYPARYRP